jgi:hypothetical protein
MGRSKTRQGHANAYIDHALQSSKGAVRVYWSEAGSNKFYEDPTLISKIHYDRLPDAEKMNMDLDTLVQYYSTNQDVLSGKLNLLNYNVEQNKCTIGLTPRSSYESKATVKKVTYESKITELEESMLKFINFTNSVALQSLPQSLQDRIDSFFKTLALTNEDFHPIQEVIQALDDNRKKLIKQGDSIRWQFTHGYVYERYENKERKEVLVVRFLKGGHSVLTGVVQDEQDAEAIQKLLREKEIITEADISEIRNNYGLEEPEVYGLALEKGKQYKLHEREFEKSFSENSAKLKSVYDTDRDKVIHIALMQHQAVIPGARIPGELTSKTLEFDSYDEAVSTIEQFILKEKGF